MAATLGIPKETLEDERRVALSPEIVKKLTSTGFAVRIESGAGAEAGFGDALYTDSGAQIVSRTDALQADAVLTVRGLSASELSGLKPGALLIGLLDPHRTNDVLQAAAQKNITALTLDLVPRITRAQNMDVLSSQANLAGYRAVIEGAALLPRAFPMMMTAAGTVAPARVFVMGAGVAGLQAIATAKRLGAVVSATDVRPAAREQVQSLGGSFVMIEDDEVKAAETSGGYAREMSDAFKAKQAALIAQTIPKQDIVITTALIPGRPAPRLVSADMVRSMKPGSVIIDMAVEQGGNCELARAGEMVDINGVCVAGFRNLPSRIATDSSALYARNLFNLLALLRAKDSADLALPLDDEIIKAITLTHQGHIIHPLFQETRA